MLTVLSLVTSVKDYIEIAHKLIESQNGNFMLPESVFNTNSETGMFFLKDYTELGAVLTYLVLSIKEFLTSFFSFAWLNQVWSLPLIVPDIASAMISEVSVLDSYFTNAFSFLETGRGEAALSAFNAANPMAKELSTAGGDNSFIYGFEKFFTGFLNSFFLFLPTSTAHLITLRRFVVQGLEAGYIAGLGTIAGNMLWLASIILGWRFIVIPWLSFDIFRYILGFSLLVKYLWDSSKELNKSNQKILEDDWTTKKSIFVLNFLLALTEQTSIYPFISNLSFGAEGSILESFSGTIFQSFTPDAHSFEFIAIHLCYLIGILLGSLSLLHFTVWFWENPAFSIYMWMITSYRVTTGSYYKVLNFIFLYLTMLCAISSIPYFGLDYTVTNPLGLIPQDRIIDQKFTTANGPGDKILPETAFLGVKSTDKNTRIRDGLHARRERWKERLMKYQAFDTSLYDQGTYDILTIEDLNYGFDRFWLRRKMRNHQIRFRLFPGPWMRSLKKQLNKPGFSGPRVEFFRILFEQYYHPIFHTTVSTQKIDKQKNTVLVPYLAQDNKQNYYKPDLSSAEPKLENSMQSSGSAKLQKGLLSSNTQNALTSETYKTHSALRKFARNANNRINNSIILTPIKSPYQEQNKASFIYSKSLKSLYAKINKEYTKENRNIFRNLSRNLLTANLGQNSQKLTVTYTPSANNFIWSNSKSNSFVSGPSSQLKKTNIRQKLSKKERLLLTYKTALYQNTPITYQKELGLAATYNMAEGRKQSLQNTQKAVSSLQADQFFKPLNYYLAKDEAFKRKFSYYSTTIGRNLNVGNNAPYLKTMLKRAFYYHKPSLRWKRTMFTAAMRRGFRKKSNRPRKLIYTTNTLTTPTVGVVSSLTAIPAQPENSTTISSTALVNSLEKPITQKTSSYSVLGKRASRYRYQIYKDVLQHWYYSPFNRLLLKFDIDSFINRQPKSHFLTQKEERLLHLRRVLLSEHYNSLRWYTYMQHYRAMKSRIGSTKSFASTVYNQQFQGTFKKIRHLFAITPAQGDLPILQFDQPLYNSKNINTSFSLGLTEPQNLASNFSPSGVNQKFVTTSAVPFMHEENVLNSNSNQNNNPLASLPEDLVEQSLTVAGNYVKTEQKLTKEKIQQYINEKNYSELSKLLALKETNSAVTAYGNNEMLNGINQASTEQNTKEILLRLLKECKRRLNDQTFMKNYITHRLDKREQRNNEAQNELNKQLESLKTWLSPIAFATLNAPDKTTSAEFESKTTSGNYNLQTTGVRKALNESVFVLNNINPATYSESGVNIWSKQAVGLKSAQPKLRNDYISSLAALEQETKIQQTLKAIKSIESPLTQIQDNSKNRNFDKKASKTLIKKLVTSPLTKSQTSIERLLKPLFWLKTQVLMKRTSKNLEWWRQKQRVVTKKKSALKQFKSLTAIINEKADLETKLQTLRTTKDVRSQQWSPEARETVQKMLEKNQQKAKQDSQNAGLLAYNNTTLRKKRTADSLNSLEADNFISGSAENASDSKVSKLFKKLFLQKFNKKMSSKGHRSRGQSMSRNFAYVRRPKNNNSLLDLMYSPVADQTEFGKPATIAISKEDKRVVFQDIQKQLAKTISKAGTSSFNSEDLQTNNIVQNQENAKRLIFGLNSQTVNNLLTKTSIKKSPIQKRSKRKWQKRKRQKFTKNHYKYRKRRMHGFGKIQNLNQKFKRIQAIQELQNWWWNSYLPNYISKTPNSFSAESAKQKQLSYKPLSTTQALDIRSKILTTSVNRTNEPISGGARVNMAEASTNTTISSIAEGDTTLNRSQEAPGFVAPSALQSQEKQNLLDQIYSNLFNLDSSSDALAKPLTNYITTNIPFYAGWDESLRKFVVTNRLLSRRDAGFRASQTEADKQTNNQAIPGGKLEFTKAPIQGLNEGSFLYLQNEMPFNSYVIDQFIPNNQSFYAPLGWKRFQFRHSLLKNWLNTASGLPAKAELTNTSEAQAKQNNFNAFFIASKDASINKKQNKQAILQNKRIKKRYKLLKQTPIQLMYVPTGSLLTELLPSHYVSVFDKQYRSPRNRYLKRFLPKVNTDNSGSLKERDLALLEYSNAKTVNLTVVDKDNLAVGKSAQFTLRKKIKPRRKYHKKRSIWSKKDGLIFPRRQKFAVQIAVSENLSDFTEANQFRLRPSTKAKQGSAGEARKKSSPASKKRLKTLRARQLRNREFKQVYKPLQRFEPRYGGFVWPGDYLRLEVFPMPKLNSLKFINNATVEETLYKADVKNKVAGSKLKPKLSAGGRINVQPVGILPRKYLLEKHNLKVLKKKLASI